MKWSENQIIQLCKLAFAEKPNPEIAKALNVDINDVYVKRSQLGITIPKVLAMKGHPAITVNPEFEKAAQEMDDELRKDCKTCHYWVCCLTGTDNKVKGCKHYITAKARERDLAYMAKTELMNHITGRLPQSECIEIRALLDSKIPDSWKLREDKQ